MIVTRRPEGIAIVLQVDHQVQCGLMAEAWGGPGFDRPEPFEPIGWAGRWHDEGWRPVEACAETDEHCRPLDFPDLDRGRHCDLYRQGIAHALRHDRRAGLLVSLHGRGLHQRRLGLDGAPPPNASLSPPVRAFVEEQEELEHRLFRELSAGPALERFAWDGYRLLQAWDSLSLYLLWRGLPQGRPGRLHRVPRGPGDAGVDIQLDPGGTDEAICDPFPFTGDVVVLPVRERTIPDRPYRSNEDLQAALAAAEWHTRPSRVRRVHA